MKLIIVLISFLLVSCASVHRVPAEKTFKVRWIDLSGKTDYREFTYYEAHNGGLNCFEEDNGQETITVFASNYEYALDYFFKQHLAVDVKVYRTFDHREVIRNYYKKSTDFEIETASCFVSNGLGLKESYFKSFRLVK